VNVSFSRTLLHKHSYKFNSFIRTANIESNSRINGAFMNVIGVQHSYILRPGIINSLSARKQ